MAQRQISDFFSRSVLYKVNEAEPTEGKFLFQNLIKLLKQDFYPSAILYLREKDVIYSF